MPKNPRRLSEFDANLSRRERRKSKAWSGESQGVSDGYGEGEGEGARRRSGPLDAEELKVFVVEKLRRVSLYTVWGVCGGWDADGYAFLDIKALVQPVLMEDAGRSWQFFRLGQEETAGLSSCGSLDPVHMSRAVGSLADFESCIEGDTGPAHFRKGRL